MNTTFNSLESLSSCSNSVLRSRVVSTLNENKYLKWNFISGSVDGDVCRAEFLSCPTDSGFAFRLTCTDTPQARRGHIEPVSCDAEIYKLNN